MQLTLDFIILEKNSLSYFTHTKKVHIKRFLSGLLIAEILQLAKTAQISESHFTRIKTAEGP